jgi:putative transposase
MNRGVEKRPIFLDDQDRARFLNLLERVIERHEWQVDSYTLMPNHYHVSGDLPEGSVSVGLHLLDGTYAASFNRRWDRVGHLFQGRARGVLVQREMHQEELDRYLVLNAVRAGLVSDPADYTWSSYRATVGLDPCPPWLAVEGVLERYRDHKAGPRAGYAEHVAAGIGAPSPWDRVVGQLCLGNDQFILDVRNTIGSDSAYSTRLRDAAAQGARLSVEVLLPAVLIAFGVSIDELQGRRSRPASSVFAHLARTRCKLPLSAIARLLRVSDVTAFRRSEEGREVSRTGDARLASLDRLIERLKTERPDPDVFPRELEPNDER